MSNRAIEKALYDLMPRYSGDLPLELIELANSLLAQSRHRASSLKAEEEIGRAYACANIACERLKTTLNLPKIESNPPCPPKVYTKLYGHLSRLFPAKNNIVSTPSRKRKREVSPIDNGNQDVQVILETGKGKGEATPSKDKSLVSFRSNRTPKKGMQYGKSQRDEKKLPRWIAPVTRMLCLRLNAKSATPHALSGIESALLLPSNTEGNNSFLETQGKIPAMIVAIMCWILPRMEGRDDLTKSRLKRVIEEISGTLRALRNNREIAARVGKKEDAWSGWEEFVEADVEPLLREMLKRGIFDMEWADNIVEGSGAEGEGDAMGLQEENGNGVEGMEPLEYDGNDDAEFEHEAADREQLMGYGLGTMRQPEVDFLSAENSRRRDEFMRFINSRIDAILTPEYLDQPTEDEEEIPDLNGSESESVTEAEEDEQGYQVVQRDAAVEEEGVPGAFGLEAQDQQDDHMDTREG